MSCFWTISFVQCTSKLLHKLSELGFSSANLDCKRLTYWLNVKKLVINFEKSLVFCFKRARNPFFVINRQFFWHIYLVHLWENILTSKSNLTTTFFRSETIVETRLYYCSASSDCIKNFTVEKLHLFYETWISSCSIDLRLHQQKHIVAIFEQLQKSPCPVHFKKKQLSSLIFFQLSGLLSV